MLSGTIQFLVDMTLKGESLREAKNRLQDLVLHWGVTTGSSNWGSSWCGGSIGWGSSNEVVHHLGVKLLGSLLGRASVASLSSTSSLSLSGITAGSVGGSLRCGSGLWVWLWLSDAVTQALWRSDSWSLGCVDDNLNL